MGLTSTRQDGRDESKPAATALAAAGATARHGNRRRWLAGLGLMLLAAFLGIAWRTGALTAAPSRASAGAAPPLATQAVTRQDLSATTPLTATLGYAGSYTVTGMGGGTLTWLPSAGRVITQGHVLYRVDNGVPVVLLHGSVPAWRTLAEGITGPDVSQLNHDLVQLGDAGRTDIAELGWDYFSSATADGVSKLEEHLGVPAPAGSLSPGQVVFEPTPLRVADVTGQLGGTAAGPVLQATSDRHVVMIALDVAQQSQVRAGNAVTVTLPDGTTTSGVVSSIGRVATAHSDSGGQDDATIPVVVTLAHPRAAGTLDQAPVTVNITTESVRNALVVPVGALLARSAGGYAVEVAGPGNSRRLVPVTPGIFDDADGLVQVTGPLVPGQRVEVPAP